MSTDEPKYAATFGAILADSQKDQPWYQRLHLRDFFTLKKMYVLTAVSSFVCFAIFGSLVTIRSECEIVNPEGRCCSCVTLTPEQLDGQEIPMITTYNDLFYGLVTIMNAVFGTIYVVYAITFENRYLLFCMIATQFIEVVRCVLDVALETLTEETEKYFAARYVLVFMGAGFMIASWLLVRPVYKLFGWRIFRRSGAKRSVRDMYKMFQRFRAMNLLDIQSAAVLMVVYIAYLDVAQSDVWVFVLLCICEIMASRFLIKYLKREDMTGVVITLVCKFVAMAWWIVVGIMYLECYSRFNTSSQETKSWWLLARVPDLQSVLSSYRGRECLAPHTVHDDRTLELIIQTLLEAVLFRIASTALAVVVCRNFHKGLRDLFYTKKRAKREDTEETMMDQPQREDDLDPYAAGEYSDEDSRRYAAEYNGETDRAFN